LAISTFLECSEGAGVLEIKEVKKFGKIHKKRKCRGRVSHSTSRFRGVWTEIVL